MGHVGVERDMVGVPMSLSNLGTTLQRNKTGNEKVMNMLSYQAICQIAVSHF